MNINIKLPQSDEIQKTIDEAGLDDMGYDPKWGRYRIRLSKNEVKNKNEVLAILFKQSYEYQK